MRKKFAALNARFLQKNVIFMVKNICQQVMKKKFAPFCRQYGAKKREFQKCISTKQNFKGEAQT